MSNAFYLVLFKARRLGVSPVGAARLALAGVLPSASLDRDSDHQAWVASHGSRSAVGWTAVAAAERLLAAVEAAS